MYETKGLVSNDTREHIKEQMNNIDFNKMMAAKTSLFPEKRTERRPDLKSIERHKRAQLQARYDLISEEWIEQKRELPDDYGSMVEVSCRASECPLPLNMDVYSGGLCFQCIYCFAKLFEQSLYSAFYDNWELENVRASSKKYVINKLNDILNGNATGEVKRAIDKRVPLRLGIRTEDFIPLERKKKVALAALKTINEHSYPVMINTKSVLLAEGEWFKVLSDMDEDIAVQMTITHTDDDLAKLIEMTAPSSSDRFKAVKTLNDVDIRTMPRIEPAMAYINLDDEHLEDYSTKCAETGAEHVTCDTYSYFANSAGIRENFYIQGLDYDRMFRATSEYQLVGSLWLEKLMFALQDKGVGSSTFNFHSIPFNTDDICCGVGTHFKSAGYNSFNLLSIAREIVKSKGSVSWGDILKRKKDALNSEIFWDIYGIWNKLKASPWAMDWCGGVEAVGTDEYGIVYDYDEDRLKTDYDRLEEVYKK